MRTGPVLIDVSPNLVGHLVMALRKHRDWAAGMALQLPRGFAEMEQHLTSRAIQGQSGTDVDDPFTVLDGQHVTPRLLTYDDTARALTCSQRTVKRLVASGELHAVRVGGIARIRVSDLDAYVAALPSTTTPSTGAMPCQS